MNISNCWVLPAFFKGSRVAEEVSECITNSRVGIITEDFCFIVSFQYKVHLFFYCVLSAKKGLGITILKSFPEYCSVIIYSLYQAVCLKPSPSTHHAPYTHTHWCEQGIPQWRGSTMNCALLQTFVLGSKTWMEQGNGRNSEHFWSFLENKHYVSVIFFFISLHTLVLSTWMSALYNVCI